MSKSNYANYAWPNKPNYPSYDGQGPDYLLGYPKNYSNAGAHKSINYYAHAQQAVPSPSIHVKQGHHMVEKMKRQESHVGQEWASNSLDCSNSSLVDHSKVMGQELDHGWANKSISKSSPSPTQAHHFSQEEEAYNFGEGGVEGGYATKLDTSSSQNYLNKVDTKQSSLIQHKEGHVIGKMDHNWEKSSPTHAQHSSLGMHDGSMMGKTNNMLANSAKTKSNSTKTHQLGLSVHTNEHIMENGEHELTYSPKKFSKSSQAYHEDMGMHAYGEEGMTGNMDHGRAYSQTKLPSSTQTHYSSSTLNQAQHANMAMQKEGHLLGKEDHSWGYSPTKLSSPTHYSSSSSTHAMQNKGPMLGKEDHSWSYSPTKLSSPTQIHHSSHSMKKEGYNHEFGNLNQGSNQSSQTMQKQGHMIGNVNQGMHHSSHTMQKEGHMIGNVNQGIHHSGHTMQNGGHMIGNVNQGTYHSGHSMQKEGQMIGSMNQGTYHSSHAVQKEGHMLGNMNHGWANSNSPARYASPNNFTSSNNSMYGAHEQHEWYGKPNNGMGLNHVSNHSSHASYDDYDQHCDEDVDDIMDEILTKYPTHNVSGAQGSNWAMKPNSMGSQNIGGGYSTKQQTQMFGSQAMANSSSSSSFQTSKHMSGGFKSNVMKQEYSASSSSNKYEAKSMINNGGLYDY